MWNTSTQAWGSGCPSNNNQFRIYVGPSAGSLNLYATVASNVGNVQFTTGNAGSTYYWRVTAANGSRTRNSGVRNFTLPFPSCTVDLLPATITMTAGTSTLTAISPKSGSPANVGAITQVNFSSSNTAVATVTSPDSSSSYTTTVTGLAALTTGQSTITASVVMAGGIVRCTDTALVTVTAVNTTPWWQVKDGDVTANGNIQARDTP
jgi:hypothetical protein